MYLRRRVTPDLAERVAERRYPGVHFDREYKRYYPAGATTAHLIGLTNIDDIGQEGAELAFDHRLRGRQGSKRVLKDNRRQTIRNLEFLSAPQFGQDVHLSIDLRLQFYAHQELQRAVTEHGAKSGSLVMVDVRNGEILALVNAPSYNPNQLTAGIGDAMRNRAVTDAYEPGSTVKPFTLLAALESGQYTPETEVNTAPGFIRVGNNLIQDPLNRGTLNLTEVLARSSQVGVAKVALSLDQESVFSAFARVGFGQPVGLGMPGESAGRLTSERLRSPIVRATMAYGYGLTVTPVQMAQAYLTLATGGYQMPLSLMRLQPGEVPHRERVFDAEHVQQILTMMEAVVGPTGTAPRARVAGYQVAGKTGTARKVGAGGYEDSRHLAFFAGLAPAEDPRIVVVVVINEPRGERTGGGEVAGPVFSRVVARALRVLSVEPSEVRWQIRA
jgi:cell division protein FtsI (penicillin-binding protein 3)